MNESETILIRPAENVGRDMNKEPSSSMHDQTLGVHDTNRVVELEIENSRLHRLVAELLIKNQQLRKSD
jgi:hypothetical protein